MRDVSYSFTLEFHYDVPSECRAAMLEELRKEGIEDSDITSLGMIVEIRVPSDQSDIVKNWIKKYSDELGVI